MEGVRLLKEGSYGGAIANLAAASERLPAVSDYSLLFVSRAYLQSGEYERAVSVVRQLLAFYSGSPLRKEAMNVEALAALAIPENEERAIEGLEKYVNEFPSDSAMMYLFGYLVKETDPGKARAIFKRLYVDSGPLSIEALRELKTADITPADLFEKSAVLLQVSRFKEAESVLRQALSMKKGIPRKETLRRLGMSLFGQKRYAEAAKTYLKAGELFEAARSFLRADNKKAFRRTVKRLLSKGEERGGEILIAHAVEQWREGKDAKALSLLKRAGKKFPDVSEYALWQTGWIHYRGKEYKRAHEAFAELSSRYPENGKYTYWRANALEKTGGDPSELYASLSNDDFYGLLSEIKNGGRPASGINSSDTLPTSVQDTPSPPLRQGQMERVDLLMEAGLSEAAVSELMLLADKGGQENIAWAALKLKEVGRYRESISLLRRLPEEKAPEEILYPVVYWQAVESASSEHGLDPMLVLSVMREESRFDPLACSPAGAVGLMQLMPETARRTARALGITTFDLRDVETNIRLGVRHLSDLVREMGSVTYALASYNAGVSNVRRWLVENYSSHDEFIEDIPYSETKNYVKRIMRTYYRYKRIPDPEYSGSSAAAVFF